jgi:sensor domain CHASE-containing protein
MEPSIACSPDRVVLAQSEFLQLLTFVVLTTYLIHRNSHESRDSDDEMQQSLNRIEKRLKSLEEAGQGGKSTAGSR